jgi:hypothetical protein
MIWLQLDDNLSTRPPLPTSDVGEEKSERVIWA